MNFAPRHVISTVCCLVDVPIGAEPVNFPVLMFAPGAGWLLTAYSAILEDLTGCGLLEGGDVSNFTNRL